MKKVKSPLIVAITAGLLAGTTIGVVAQEDASGSYTFKRLAQPTENAQTNFLGIAELPSGVLGVVGGSRPGGNGYEPLAWASRDGGETWTETPFDMPPGESGIGTIVTHGDAFVAVGGNGPFDATPTSRVFTSPDGVSWDAASTLDGAFITSLIATPDGLAMLGLEFREAEGFGSTLAGYPSLWLSADATTWDVHEITTPLYGPDEEDPQVLSGLARSDDGDWLATGVVNDFADEDGPPNKAFHVWHSPDGVEWTQGSGRSPIRRDISGP